MAAITGAEERVELAITGMTCASCAARIEKKLNRMAGVSATVNYATETAAVAYPPGVSPGDLIATVEATGYGASLSGGLPARLAGHGHSHSHLHGRTVAADLAGSAAELDGLPAGPAPAGVAAPAAGASAEPRPDSPTLPPPTATPAPPTPPKPPTPRPTPRSTALRPRLLISTLLTAPVLVLSMVPPLQFRGWQWLALVLATPVVFWGGAPFHRAAWTNLKHGAATMDTLVSLGTLAAYLWSLYALTFGSAGQLGMRMDFTFTSGRSAFGGASGGADDIYFEVASAVTVFILLGRYLEDRAKRSSGAALRALLELGAKDAVMLDPDGSERSIPIEQLAAGDLFIVRPGEKIATDGEVVEGASAVDASMLTGESVPIEVGPGASVSGGTVNSGGRLLVRATRVGADTRLAQITQLVVRAQTGKAKVQRLADRVSGIFVPVVLALAAATLAGWLLAGGGATQAFTAAVAVLIIACPCALGLATPTALLVGTGRGAQLGLLIKGPEVLESTRRVDTVVLDKTGTVTTGQMRLLAIHTADPSIPPAPNSTLDPHSYQLLHLSGAVEHQAEHPIARAIARAASAAQDARGLGTIPPVVEDFRALPGLGVSGVVEGHAVVVGRPSYLEQEWALPLPASLAESAATAVEQGQTVVAVAWDGALRGLFVVADAVKPGARAAVDGLRALGLEPMLLTGDHAAAARAVAAQVGIPESSVIAEVLPEDKAEVVERLQARGRVVAMAGDGVNDAAALATADLGLSMGSGTDAAIEAADLTLVRTAPDGSGVDLNAAVDAIRLSRRTLSTIKGNLFWAFAYNLAAIPLAALGLLNPLISGAAMAGSSLFVVSNSLRLRRFRSLPLPAAPIRHPRAPRPTDT